MSRLPLIGALLLAGCATNPELASNEPLDRCEDTACFNQNTIRRFDVVDENSLIVYVGTQECPFLVRLTGTFCDATYLPGFDVVFVPTRQRQQREPDLIGAARVPLPGDLRNSIDTGRFANMRICSNDIDFGIASGPFISAGGADRDSDVDGLACRIESIASITDDEILEIFADEEIAPPPPPLGPGEISGGEAPAAEGAATDPDLPQAELGSDSPVAAVE